MLIASWNINSVRARLPLLLQWLNKEKPDIVLLQEIKTQLETFPFSEIDDIGYNSAIFGQKSYNGVAILSRHQIEDIKTGIPDLKNDEARFIECFTNGIRIASIYVPNGQEPYSQKFFEKEEFFSLLTSYAKKLLCSGEKVVLGGDFNVAPTDSDTWDPKLWDSKITCTKEERSWFSNLVDSGFTEVLKNAKDENGATPFTWWNYMQKSAQKNHGLRIDHFLVSEINKKNSNFEEETNRLEKSNNNISKTKVTTNCGVHRYMRFEERPSDHAPVWIDI